ncbi:MAG: M28 family metallopeptidase [Pyrinomonadaceae bacterium]
MAQAIAIDSSGPVAISSRTNFYIGLTMFFFILLMVLLSIGQQAPPAVVPASAPPTEFSAQRAMRHVTAIAQKPHPVGTTEHAKVREYIVNELSSLGVSPQVQTVTSVNEPSGPPYRAATINNIIARLKGTANSKAILVVGHYDSVPTGPGASDDGSAIGAMLETLRALKAGAPLKNDVIFLFSDAEEIGSLGAKGFVDQHPWAKDVGLVLNFEARGSGGPATMFETSNNNGWLISEFAKAAPYPLANSLSYEIYKLLPNDTDLTVFKKAGFAGLNFAYIKGVVNYHSATDNLNTIDERSLQQQGSYALSLTRHFADLDSPDVKKSNAIYFNLFGTSLVHYSSAWAIPLMILTFLVFVGVIVLGWRRGRLTFFKMVLGFFALLLSMISVAVMVSLVWALIRAMNGGYNSLLQGDTYNSNLYMLAFTALTVAITSAIYILLRKKITTENLTMGALCWWMVLTVLTSLFMPGGSYLFTWPLLFSLLALGSTFFWGERRLGPLGQFAVLAVGAIPALILLAPTIHFIFIGLTLAMCGAVMVLVALLMGALIPHLSLMTNRQKWLLPGGMLLACVALIGAGNVTHGFDRNHPQPDTILYGLNADTAKAVWASADKAPDEWTAQFLGGHSRQGTLAGYIPATSRGFLQSDAPAAPLAAPNVELLSDTTNNDVRTVRLRISSPRQAPVVSLELDPQVQFLGGAINGRRLENRLKTPSTQATPWGLRYYALPSEGIELTLEAKSSQPIVLRVIDQSYGLPEIQGMSIKPRPDYMIASILPYTDSTFVSKSFKF